MLKQLRKGETKRGNVLYMFKPNGKEFKVKVRKVETVGKAEKLHYESRKNHQNSKSRTNFTVQTVRVLKGV